METTLAPQNTQQPLFKRGNEKLCQATETASHKLKELLTQKKMEQGALRIAVIGGGCSGLQYKMDLIEGPQAKDILVESKGVRLVMDPKSALFVSGSQIDYSHDLMKGGFKVSNPNASSHCSCGESFSL